MTDFTTWQLIDSAFPTGGFAHSGGLEAAWQSGEVQTSDDLSRFVRDSLWQAGHAVLPFVTAAHDHPERLEALDAFCDAFVINAVANRASRVQGRSFVASCMRVWPGAEMAALDDRVRGMCGHYGPVAGATLRALGVPLPIAQRLVLFSVVRGAVAAAVRLGVAGTYEAQRVQHASYGDLERVLERCASLDDSDVAQTAPLLDLLQSTHDRLYSRLFQS